MLITENKTSRKIQGILDEVMEEYSKILEVNDLREVVKDKTDGDENLNILCIGY